MNFEAHVSSSEEEEEIGTQVRSENHEAANGEGGGRFRYMECEKNQAIGVETQAFDGCGEFMPAGDEGTLEAMLCAACNCHRNYHRKVPEVAQAAFHSHRMTPPPYNHRMAPPPYYFHPHNPSGHMHAMASPPPHHHHPPVVVPPPISRDNAEEIANPSSSRGGSQKRFRTKFTQFQKDRMLAFSVELGWRIKKEDEAAVQLFCVEMGITRQVLKVWMHNNKHTLGKKP